MGAPSRGSMTTPLLLLLITIIVIPNISWASPFGRLPSSSLHERNNGDDAMRAEMTDVDNVQLKRGNGAFWRLRGALWQPSHVQTRSQVCYSIIIVWSD
jgi:hypothetical protein